MLSLRWLSVYILIAFTVACDGTPSRRVGDPCTRTEECSDGICGQGECLPPHTIELPQAPVLIEITPPSPSNDPSPQLVGQAYPGETVAIYRDAACTEMLAEVEADNGGRFSAHVDVEEDSSQTFYLQSRSGQLKSRCAATSFEYTHSSQRPADPILSEIIPPSPASEPNPYFVGQTAPFAYVNISVDTACESPLDTVQANGHGLFVVQLEIPEGQSLTFYAEARSLAGNTSHCVLWATYEHIWPAPNPPWQAQQGDTPKQSIEPVWLTFCAESDATTHFYNDRDCSGTPLPATPYTDTLCEGHQGYEVPVLGELYGQSSGRKGGQSACTYLGTITPLPPPDEIVIHSVRATNWVRDGQDIIESAFLIGGYTRPHAQLSVFLGDTLIGQGEASDTGRFEIPTTSLETPTVGELGVSVSAAIEPDAAFAYRETLLVGQLDFYTLYGDIAIPNLDYLLHLPDGEVLSRRAFDNHGRARLHLVAGMGLSVFYSSLDSPYPLGLEEASLRIETIMDLTPGAPIVWNYKDVSWELRNYGLLPELPSTPAPEPVDIVIPMPPAGVRNLQLITNCLGSYGDGLWVDQNSSWPHVLRTSSYTPGCLEEEAELTILATAMDEDGTLAAYIEYSQPHQDVHVLGDWVPAEDYFSTERRYTYHNDSERPLQTYIMSTPALLTHINTSLPFYPGGLSSVSHDTVGVSEQLGVSGFGDLTTTENYLYLQSTSPHHEDELPVFQRRVFDLRPPAGDMLIYDSELLPYRPVYRDVLNGVLTLTTPSGDAYDHAQLAATQSHRWLYLPCLRPHECGPCFERGGCELTHALSVTWHRVRNPWGDILFTEDTETLRATLPPLLQPWADFGPHASSSTMHLRKIAGAPPWLDYIRAFEYGVNFITFNGLYPEWKQAYPELRVESLTLRPEAD